VTIKQHLVDFGLGDAHYPSLWRSIVEPFSVDRELAWSSCQADSFCRIVREGLVRSRWSDPWIDLLSLFCGGIWWSDTEGRDNIMWNSLAPANLLKSRNNFVSKLGREGRGTVSGTSSCPNGLLRNSRIFLASPESRIEQSNISYTIPRSRQVQMIAIGMLYLRQISVLTINRLRSKFVLTEIQCRLESSIN
jgi:hypothetical protein